MNLRTGPLALLGLLAVAAAWTAPWIYVSDEGFLAARVARSLALGDGFVLHPTDPGSGGWLPGTLWPLLLAAASPHGTETVTSAPHLGLALGAALLCTVWALAIDRNRPAWTAWWATAALAASLPFQWGVQGGTEDALFTLLLLWTIGAWTRSPRPEALVFGSVCAIAMAATREDGGMWAALVAWTLPGSTPTRRIVGLAAFALPFLQSELLADRLWPWALHLRFALAEPVDALRSTAAVVLMSWPLAGCALLLRPLGATQLRPFTLAATVAFIEAATCPGAEPLAARNLLPAIALLAVAMGPALAAVPRPLAVFAIALSLGGLGASFDVSPVPRSIRVAVHAEAGEDPVVAWSGQVERTKAARRSAELLRRLGTGTSSVVSEDPGTLGYYSRWRVLDPRGHASPRAWSSLEGDANIPFLADRPTVLAFARVHDERAAKEIVDRWRSWAADHPDLHVSYAPQTVDPDDSGADRLVALVRSGSPESALSSWAQ